jgi:hypothetical protein
MQQRSHGGHGVEREPSLASPILVEVAEVGVPVRHRQRADCLIPSHSVAVAAESGSRRHALPAFLARGLDVAVLLDVELYGAGRQHLQAQRVEETRSVHS